YCLKQNPSRLFGFLIRSTALNWLLTPLVKACLTAHSMVSKGTKKLIFL
mgnify:CR=1